jgi:nucleoside-diphosphate-sugar epimerase
MGEITLYYLAPFKANTMSAKISKSSINILLTGTTGFLGSHLLERMLLDGYHVTAIKRSSSNTWRVKKWLEHPNLILFDIDNVTDPRSMFEKKQVDIIIHTATDYGRAGTNISHILEANLTLPIRLIELGIEYGVKCFLNTDSFFNKKDNGYSNLLNYSLTKRSLVLWLRELSSNIRVVNIMLEHVYGPFDSKSKFVENLIQQIAIKKVARIALTPGDQKRDFVYIEDVVKAYICLMLHGLSNDFSFEEYEVGSGISIRVREFTEVVKRVSDSNTVLGFGDISYGKNETMDSKADISSLKKLGWAPETTLENGIPDILKIYNA